MRRKISRRKATKNAIRRTYGGCLGRPRTSRPRQDRVRRFREAKELPRSSQRLEWLCDENSQNEGVSQAGPFDGRNSTSATSGEVGECRQVSPMKVCRLGGEQGQSRGADDAADHLRRGTPWICGRHSAPKTATTDAGRGARPREDRQTPQMTPAEMVTERFWRGSQ